MKALARDKRRVYSIEKPRVLRTDMRRIFKAEGIHLDYWSGPFRSVRGAYFNDQYGATIMVRKDLPPDPCVFTMAHELKHHFVDTDAVISPCKDTPSNDMVEIGAEIFAAEFLFPEASFKEEMERMGISSKKCCAETLVHLKQDTKTTLSYAGLCKLAVWLGFAEKDSLPKTGWKKLEEQIFGVPSYRKKA